MQHRIRGAALIVRDGTLLLVKHQDPVRGSVWWCPPGGGIEGSETIFDCVHREVWEETGLTIEIGDLAYFREFVESDRGIHHLELFFVATYLAGEIVLGNAKGLEDEQWIKDAQFLSADEVQSLTVYPEILKDAFWSEFRDGLGGAKYLGTQHV
jgi:ADP-ribose pyrophosphatase YjhB (NUDIX family)